jgi:hypothetical protein
VKTKTPLLPGFSSQLYGRAKRRQLEALRLRRDLLVRESISDYGALFSDILPPVAVDAASSDARRSRFPQAVTFWAWAGQILECNASCARAVTLVQSWCEQAQLPPPSADTSAYCKARRRLPESFLEELGGHVRDYAGRRAAGRCGWEGHRLKAIDGSSVRLMDTPKNQAEFPQPSTQKEGCGFPVMGFAGVLDLDKGTLETYHLHRHEAHDTGAAHALLGSFDPGDVVVADRAYCSYALIASLKQERGADSVMRLHQSRSGKLDWRKGRRQGKDSRLVIWKKPKRGTLAALDKAEWAGLPAELEMRYVRVRARSRAGKMRNLYIATTLTDTQKYPDEKIAALYMERWKIEVKFRDIKTTLGLEAFNVRTPEMAAKTMRMVQVTYNLLKAIQSESIRGSGEELDAIGFKATVDVIAEFRGRFLELKGKPRLRARAMARLEERIVERKLDIRPGRTEPRAVKLRPKGYQLLTKPRGEFIGIDHRSRYKKSA